MRANVSTAKRCTIVLALLLAVSVVGTLRAQTPPAAELVLTVDGVERLSTSAGGALFAFRSVFAPRQTLDVLMQSDDGGTSWREVGLPPLRVGEFERRAVSVQPRNHVMLYSTGREGLYRSDDGGATWQLIRPTTRRIDQIVVSPADDRLLYLTELLNAGENPAGILRSRDGGTSWEAILSGACAHLRLTPHPTNAARVVAAISCSSERPIGLYVSEDQGDTWTTWRPWPTQNVHARQEQAVTGALVVDAAPGQPARTYVAFTSYSLEQGLPLYRTDDLGQSWDERLVGPREEIPPASPTWRGGPSWSSISALAVDPADPERLYVGLSGSSQPLRTSTDGGATWSEIALPGSFRSVTALTLGADGQTLYVATSSGVGNSGTAGIYRVRIPER